MDLATKQLYDKFICIMQSVYTKENLSTVPKKYYNLERLFSRFFVLLNYITQQKRNLNKGLDFGCGCGVSVVLGRILGFDITGLDVINNQYTKIQKALCDMGYPIVICDTNKFPWVMFIDDSFDFISAYSSIIMPPNFTELLENYSKVVLMVPDIVNKYDKIPREPVPIERYKELIRITKPGGSWFVSPEWHLRMLPKEIISEINKKNIKSMFWDIAL